MKEKFKEWLIPGIMIIACAIFVFLNQPKDKVSGAAAGWLDGYSSTTNVASSTVVGMANTGSGVASSTLVLYANSARVYARITNIGVDPATCLLGSVATSSTNYGIILLPIASSTPDSKFELTRNNPYTGAVYCFAQSTTTISSTEN